MTRPAGARFRLPTGLTCDILFQVLRSGTKRSRPRVMEMLREVLLCIPRIAINSPITMNLFISCLAVINPCHTMLRLAAANGPCSAFG